jgi:hypothetical protein
MLSLLAVSATASCELYDSPPRPSIDGLVDGVLPDRTQPVVLRFSEPIAPETLVARIIEYKTDAEGNILPDAEEFFALDQKNANLFGTAELQQKDTVLVITPGKPLPIGATLALVLNAGLSDLEGNKQDVEKVLLFTYRLSCDDSGGTMLFPSGTYFFLANVEEPLPVQVQLWGKIEVDAATGAFVGQFTNADRNLDPNRCSPPCESTEACRLLPAEDCVVPSLEAVTDAEHTDFVVNETPPTGYSFRVEGCVAESGGSVAFVNLPADVVIQQPAVTIGGIQLTASFKQEGDDFRGTGGVTADEVLIGTTPSGPAKGSVLARLVPPDQEPPGLPGPSAE